MNPISEPSTDDSLEVKRALLRQLLKKRAGAAALTAPLSHGQRALWFLDRLSPHSAAYNVPFLARVRSTLDPHALRRAFQSLLDRHPSLRTTYAVRAGQSVQQVHQHQEVDFLATDVSTWNQAALDQQLEDEVHRPFDLERGPVLRVHLFTRSAQDHVLLLVVHHIAVDGVSLTLLLDELRLLYAAETTGVPASLPPLQRDYADYARWQTDVLAGPEGERLWAYWRQQLAGELPTLALATDHPRPPVQTYRGATHAFPFTEELTKKLRALAQAEGTTLYMVLLAAFQVLLSRYTGQLDILIGSIAAGRTRAEFAGVVGYFVNPVVLRANLSGRPTFQALLGQSRQTLLAALAHQDFPFSLLAERLPIRRDPSRSPLFQAMFLLSGSAEGLESFRRREPGLRVELDGVLFESIAVRQRTAQFDLTLEMTEWENALVVSFNYNTDLFTADTIARMAGHFQVLLEGIVAHPEQSVAELPLLTTSERTHLLDTWNATAHPLPATTLPALFETQVAKTPEAVAVVCGGQRLTYHELNAHTNQLAHHLQALGVGPGDRIGVCLERSPELVIAVLGILKAGGAYVPLDVDAPPERLTALCQEARLALVLTSQGRRPSLPVAARVRCLDTDQAAIARRPRENFRAPLSPDATAYVICTSGSTGRPKVTGATHRGCVNLVRWYLQEFEITSRDKVLLMTSASFDLTQKNLFAPLSVGGTLVLFPSDVYDPRGIAAVIAEQRITLVNCTPSAWYPVIEEVDASALHQLASLRHVVLGGEPITLARLRPWLASPHGHAQLTNSYGPTECTDVCAAHRLTAEEREGTAPVPIGRPVWNTQLLVLNQTLQPQPVGVPGELCILGMGVGTGYVNDPRLTAEKFLPSPFGQQPGARLYKTGDLVRWRPDGTLELLGRSDFQVKLRGFRIELGEIEAALARHPAVREAVVLLREEAPGDPRLAAYVVLHQGSALTLTDLRTALRQQLPDYMVPAAVVVLEALPLTPHGKVDRQRLPAPEPSRRQADADYLAPQTELERTIASIWQELLHVESVGLHDNFFDLGAHSLLLIQAHRKLQEILRRDFSLIDFFRYPTTRSLAEALSQEVPDAEPAMVRKESLRVTEGRRRLGHVAKRRRHVRSYQEHAR